VKTLKILFENKKTDEIRDGIIVVIYGDEFFTHRPVYLQGTRINRFKISHLLSGACFGGVQEKSRQAAINRAREILDKNGGKKAIIKTRNWMLKERIPVINGKWKSA